VGFEGIVASGKTTQSRLLADVIPAPEMQSEFGDHELGRYLGRFGSPGMRLTPEGCDTSYVRHLLALSSHMQKLQAAGQKSAKNAVLLDVATLTDTAYALADLPESVADVLRPTMRSAVNSLIAIVQPPADRGVLIYLDCDPKVAAERLERRAGTSVSTAQVDFLIRMHGAYEYLLSDRPDVRRVDAGQDVEDVAAAVREHVQHLIR
jgi:thymidylate kinase